MKLIKEKETTKRYNVLKSLLKMAGAESILDFQKKYNLEADGLCGNDTFEKLYKTILNVEEINFEGHYYKETAQKKQIVLHHSAGWDDARGMFSWWMNDKVYHVATAIGITDDGKVYRGFNEDYWGHHIGMQNWQNLQRNKESVAVEICNWGALTEKGGKYYSWSGAEIPKNKVVELNYKGVKYYESYTDKEIGSLKIWILLMACKYDIPLDYNEKDLWDVSQKGIQGVPGIYTHNSFISWKSDISPQPKMIEMLKSLKKFEAAA